MVILPLLGHFFPNSEMLEKLHFQDCDPYALAIAALHTNRLLKDRS